MVHYCFDLMRLFKVSIISFTSMALFIFRYVPDDTLHTVSHPGDSLTSLCRWSSTSRSWMVAEKVADTLFTIISQGRAIFLSVMKVFLRILATSGNRVSMSSSLLCDLLLDKADREALAASRARIFSINEDEMPFRAELTFGAWSVTIFCLGSRAVALGYL